MRRLALGLLTRVIRLFDRSAAKADDQIPSLTPDEFDSRIAGKEPIAVDFWAGWNLACLMIAPTLLEVFQRKGAPTLAKVNLGEYPEVAKRLGLPKAPLLILYSGGQELLRVSEFPIPKQDLMSQIDQALDGT